MSGLVDPSVCQVDSCNTTLNEHKVYYRRHKVCEPHSKASQVVLANVVQRFCQQCSRFHCLDEFDADRRSCRRRLIGHNKRRRKPGSGQSNETWADGDGDGDNSFTVEEEGIRVQISSDRKLPPYGTSGLADASVLSGLRNAFSSSSRRTSTAASYASTPAAYASNEGTRSPIQFISPSLSPAELAVLLPQRRSSMESNSNPFVASNPASQPISSTLLRQAAHIHATVNDANLSSFRKYSENPPGYLNLPERRGPGPEAEPGSRGAASMDMSFFQLGDRSEGQGGAGGPHHEGVASFSRASLGLDLSLSTPEPLITPEPIPERRTNVTFQEVSYSGIMQPGLNPGLRDSSTALVLRSMDVGLTSANEEAALGLRYSSKSLTGSVSFRKIGRRSTFPSHFEAAVEDWLAIGTSNRDVYVRSDFGMVTVVVRMSAVAWQHVMEDLPKSIERFMETAEGHGCLWREEAFTVQVNGSTVFVRSGEVRPCQPPQIRSPPILTAVTPLCLVSGMPSLLTISGTGIHKPDMQAITYHRDRMVRCHTCQPVMTGVSPRQYVQVTVSLPAVDSLSSPRLLFGVEQMMDGQVSNQWPLLVADEQISSEIRSLEAFLVPDSVNYFSNWLLMLLHDLCGAFEELQDLRVGRQRVPMGDELQEEAPEGTERRHRNSGDALLWLLNGKDPEEHFDDRRIGCDRDCHPGDDSSRQTMTDGELEGLISFAVGRGWWCTCRQLQDLVRLRRQRSDWKDPGGGKKGNDDISYNTEMERDKIRGLYNISEEGDMKRERNESH